MRGESSIIYIMLTAIIIGFSLPVFGQDKFPIPESTIEIKGEPSPNRYFDVVGRRAFLMGNEGGAIEAWITPFKIAHNIRFSFSREDLAARLQSEVLAREIIVRPESTTTVFMHEEFSVKATAFVPLDESAIVILLDVKTAKQLTISLSFMTDLRPMWPAALGGQYSFWDGEKKAFILSESRRRYNALIGSPFASAGFSTPAHRLSETPNRFEIPITPEAAAAGYIPILFAGGQFSRDDAIALYNRVLGQLAEFYQERIEHARFLKEDLLGIDSPDDELDLAVEWGKVALDDGLSTNPDLGTGLIAGYGLSGRSERPGFAWYFGGDTFFNQFAINGYGDFATVRTALELIRRNQRQDGKIMHELSQGAGMLNWFEDYPYGYYHLETSPYYIISVWNYYKHSGDLEFLRDSWPSMLKAYEYTLTTETDGDGLPENSKGGLGAMEVGVFLDNLKTDIYVAGCWVEALNNMESAARVLGEQKPSGLSAMKGKAEESLSKLFFIGEKGFHALAISEDGTAMSELTAWPALAMMFGLFPEQEALQTLEKQESPELTTGWGVRMLTNKSSVYDPVHYNNGAVWPILSGYVAMAQYRYNRPSAGFRIIRSLAGLTFEDSRGDISEVYSGDFPRPLAASVGHQLFSTGGLMGAVTRGLLGILPDASQKLFAFAPQLPREWHYLKIRNMAVAGMKLNCDMKRSGDRISYLISCDEPLNGWRVRFSPSYPLEDKVAEISVNGESAAFDRQHQESVTVISIEFPLSAETKVEVSFR